MKLLFHKHMKRFTFHVFHNVRTLEIVVKLRVYIVIHTSMERVDCARPFDGPLARPGWPICCFKTQRREYYAVIFVSKKLVPTTSYCKRSPISVTMVLK